jgi:hypothetical protein
MIDLKGFKWNLGKKITDDIKIDMPVMMRPLNDVDNVRKLTDIMRQKKIRLPVVKMPYGLAMPEIVDRRPKI